MYSETNRRYAARRADGEFLRRMSGGELTGTAFPVMIPVREKDTPPEMQSTCDGMPLPNSMPDSTCRADAFAPSLAMVYSPRQCWRELLEPKEALSEGSLFKELILPFEAVSNQNGKEVRIRRPF